MNGVSIAALCISAVMMVIGIATFVITLTNKSKKDGETLAEIRTTLNELVSTVKEVKQDVKGMISDLSSVDKRVYALENKFDHMEKDVEWLKSLIEN